MIIYGIILMDTNELRLLDVFASGPLQIIISTYITRSPLLRYFMLITGIMNILYNGYNFLLFNSTLKQPLPILNNFIHVKNGKKQIKFSKRNKIFKKTIDYRRTSTRRNFRS